MKKSIFLLLSVVLLASCNSIKVYSDYDSQVDFKQYKTFAFYKSGIDESKISDLDKKRILRAIEVELKAKGLTISNNPDILVSFFTKSRKQVNVNQNYNGFGWGWNPYWGGRMNNNNINVTQYTEGTLFVDFIDKDKKELIWQGYGTGALKNEDREKKEARIKEFVKEIIAKYPPSLNEK